MAPLHVARRPYESLPSSFEVLSKQNRSTCKRWNFINGCWGRSTRLWQGASTTWLGFTIPRVATLRQNHSFCKRWLLLNKSLGLIIPTLKLHEAILPLCVRRCSSLSANHDTATRLFSFGCEFDGLFGDFYGLSGLARVVSSQSQRPRSYKPQSVFCQPGFACP